MSLFANLQGNEPKLSDYDIASALDQVKKTARINRLVVVGPVLFAAAVLGAFVAAPPTYSDLLVTEAEASDEPQLPRVFGADGVWNFAEPIAQQPPPTSGPASMVEAPVDSLEPSYVLVPPTDFQSFTESFPVSASTPPSPTPEQSASASTTEVEWSRFTPVIRVEPPVVVPSPPESEASVAADPAEAPAKGSVATTDTSTSSSPSSGTSDAGIPGEVFPSLPPQGSSIDTSEPATIVPVSVLVHSARVTVRVQVIDEDSSHIDACNSYIDWGDGFATGMTTVGDTAACATSCTAEGGGQVAEGGGQVAEGEAAAGINAELLFEHDYAGVIDAEPRVFIASGDGCNFQLAELGLPRIAIVPWS